MQSGIIVVAAIAYLLVLFAVASLGDRRAAEGRSGGSRPGVYALSLAVYCTSWTFLGSVGVAARDGFSFLAIYIGPILVFLLGQRLMQRVIGLAKAEKITTIADFLGSRYGKSNAVAAIATLIALIGAVPYIALQLKAVSASVATLAAYYQPQDRLPPFFADSALFVAALLGIFAILFGTRHADATEHQDGLVLAIATESIVKLAAFAALGVWVCFGLFAPGELWQAARASPAIREAFSHGPDGHFLASLVLSGLVILLLPRQFHMTVVENRSPEEVRRARWLFPLYLVAINLFVVPIAAAAVLTLGRSVDADLYVLSLPLSQGNDALALVAFLGGLSASTAMAIVASVALSIMVSNDIVLPVLLKRRDRIVTGERDATRLILAVRRTAILCIVMLGYLYYRFASGSTALASIGLLSFAAVAQFAPPFFLGLVWKGANARGAKAGLVSGIAIWAYTLLLPAVWPGAGLIAEGPLGIVALRPQALFGLDLDPLLHGVLISLGINTIALVAGSLSRQPSVRERIQASIFVRQDGGASTGFRRARAGVSVGELKATVARYLGAERTERAFESFAATERRVIADTGDADSRVIGFSEQLLGSAIGAASSRLVLSLLLQRHKGSRRLALRLLDDASEALQYNRDILRLALDQVDQGLAVFDQDFRLTFWNRQLRDLLDLPPRVGQVGTPLTAVLEQMRLSGEIDGEEYSRIFEILTSSPALRQITLQRSRRVIEIRTHPMPEGGLVLTVSDMTERVRHASALRDMNETLEERVRRRTAELLSANAALAEARQTADVANIGKTRFLAAAGHDILQPLNAAKLYAAALQERHANLPGKALAANINSSLESVEAILGAVLDISRLDAGGMPSKLEDFPLEPLLRQIRTDLAPLAEEKGVALRFVPTSVTVRSDRNLLRRLLQNLVSNAVKYTREGKVVVGVRHGGSEIDIAVVDSGIGIPEDQLSTIFQEFIRLDEGSRTAEGLGLGLSIVDRIARVLDHKVAVRSVHGKGTRFRVTVPKRCAASVPTSVPAPVRIHRALRLDGMQVLAIDNDAAIRDAMAALLSGWGCGTILAASAGEALAALAGGGPGPDIALVDYHLDAGNGLDAIALLRRHVDPDFPALLVTADRSAAVRERAAALGVDILTKPLKPASLRAAMAQHRARREAAE